MFRLDYRVGSKELQAPLTALGLPVCLTTLEFGDCAFGGYGPGGDRLRIGVERKTLDDLLACLRSNRFAGHQLPGLLHTYDVVYLLLEGVYRPDPHTGVLQAFRRGTWVDAGWTRSRMMYTDFDGFLTTIEQRGQIQIARTSSDRETCYWLAGRYRWWQKAWEKHTSLQPMFKALQGNGKQKGTPDATYMGTASVFRKMIAQIPDIGWVRSKAVETHFQDFDNFAAGGVREWQTIPGIGKTIAARVHRLLHTKSQM